MSSRSHDLFVRANERIPGGVNSPVRACVSVGMEPFFVASASGSRITTVDGEKCIDFVQSWGPLLLGHAHPAVTKAVTEAAGKGTSYGAPCEDEVLLAEAVAKAMPHVEMVRMVNSGTEATMSALRLARAATNRNKLIKFEGCYHGHADAFLASAGSGVATLSIPGTPGVPEAVVADTLLAPYNDLAKVAALFAAQGKDIAAVIVEPVAGNMGLVPPAPGFLQGLRELCDKHGALLIFDEVITGFRVAFGGAAARFGVTPDLTTLGKIIGGGLPVGAYGGRRDLMQKIAPCGGVYQAGTLSGNPLAMAAGLATLSTLAQSDYAALEQRVEHFCAAMQALFTKRGIPAVINRLASMFTIFFTASPVTDFATAKTGDTARYAKFYQAMRKNGIALAPSAFEAAMVSFAHSDEDLAQTLKAVEAAIADL
ncbi:glutamate-1-semialdehyde 2,1-aminomutase [Desulfovibrio sp. OttesenSCG-928-O18]|nr:glutamate-1-semialdehyde 2,1-aminomutase [Desulfovibrio sp. OttesenSCG-928-O18]